MSDSQQIENTGEVEFSDYRFNFSTELLTHTGKAIDLPPKPSRILALLLQSPLQLVTREQIIAHVWSDQVVDFDQNINFCIKQIREQLNDNPRQPMFLETIPKKGYRFLIAPKPVISDQQSTHSLLGLKRYLLPAIAGIVCIAALGALFLGNGEYQETMISQDIKRGLYLLDQGDEQSRKLSVSIFEKSIQESPDSSQGYAGLVLANLFRSQNEQDRSRVREYLASAKQLSPNHVLTHLATAKVAFYFDWDVESAAIAFKAAAQQDPNSIMILHDLAVVAVIQGDLALAERSIEKILEIDPGRFQRHYHAGWFYQAAGKYDLALKQCSESLELAPNHGYSLLCAGRSALKLKLNQTANHYFRTFMQSVGASATDINDVSKAIERGNSDTFSLWFINWLESNGNDPFNLALAYGELGQFDAALEALQSAVANKHIMIPTALAFDELSTVRDDERFLEVMQVVNR